MTMSQSIRFVKKGAERAAQRQPAEGLDNERRTTPRVPIQLYVQPWIQDEPVVFLTENISEGGLLVLNAEAVPGGFKPGQVIPVELWLPDDGEPTRAMVRVRWRGEHELEDEPKTASVGLEFVALTEADSTKLMDFIEVMSAPLPPSPSPES